jgi:hypothetical protein
MNIIVLFVLIFFLLLFIGSLIILVLSPNKDDDFILSQEQINIIESENINKDNNDILEINCGSDCTSDLACKGFSYDPINKKCIISSNLQQNSLSMKTCNKINPLTDFDLIDDNNLVRNSIYFCYDGTFPKRTNNINQNENRIQYINNRKIVLQTSKDNFIDNYPSPININYEYTNLN